MQKDDHVSFHLINKQSWDTGHLISKSGESTGKWKNSYDVLCPGKSARLIDFTHDVAEWKYHYRSDDIDIEKIQSPTLLAEADNDILAAKQREL